EKPMSVTRGHAMRRPVYSGRWLAAMIVVPLIAAAAAVKADDAPAAALDLKAMKADYQRPSEIPTPQDNAYSTERAALGKTLFFDPRLSGSGALSCATCHNPALGWGDGLKTGIGHMGSKLGRHTP